VKGLSEGAGGKGLYLETWGRGEEGGRTWSVVGVVSIDWKREQCDSNRGVEGTVVKKEKDWGRKCKRKHGKRVGGGI